MNRYQNFLTNTFFVLSGIFIAFLMVTVYYEVYLTHDLPTENQTKLENITQKYTPITKWPNFTIIQEAHGVEDDVKIYSCIKQIGEYNATFFYDVPCYDENSRDSAGDIRNSESYGSFYQSNKHKSHASDDSKDKDEDDEDEQGGQDDNNDNRGGSERSDKDGIYSIQICPPKCAKDQEIDKDEDRDEEQEQEDEDDEDRESAKEASREEEKAMKEAEDDEDEDD
jgi:hypothetical protein